jgi:hypothetical protein
MNGYLCHATCGRRIAKFVGKVLPEPGYTIKSRDFILMNDKRPTAFSSIVCPYCKAVTTVDELYLELDDVIQHLDSRSH